MVVVSYCMYSGGILMCDVAATVQKEWRITSLVCTRHHVHVYILGAICNVHTQLSGQLHTVEFYNRDMTGHSGFLNPVVYLSKYGRL